MRLATVIVVAMASILSRVRRSAIEMRGEVENEETENQKIRKQRRFMSVVLRPRSGRSSRCGRVRSASSVGPGRDGDREMGDPVGVCLEGISWSGERVTIHSAQRPQELIGPGENRHLSTLHHPGSGGNVLGGRDVRDSLN